MAPHLARPWRSANVSALPCCANSTQEPTIMGRCTMWAQKDKCGQFCPVACGLCQLCEGHPDRDAYRKFYRKARFKPRFWSPRCKVSAWEPQLQRLVKAIFAEGLLRNGSIVDSGAHLGGESCFFAELDSARTVHAIEPLLDNVKHIRSTYADRVNLRPLHGALGRVDKWVDGSLVQRSSGQMLEGLNEESAATGSPHQYSDNASVISFRMHRLDELFFRSWPSERLAFAHFDVEGSELDLLMGGSAVLRRDRPIFTAEVMIHRSESYNQRMLAMLDKLAYRAYLVPEQCGLPYDCRNLICMPREKPLRLTSLVATTVQILNASMLAAAVPLPRVRAQTRLRDNKPHGRAARTRQNQRRRGTISVK